jgi:hypothetical protein
MTVSRRTLLILAIALSAVLLWRWSSFSNHATLVESVTQQKTQQQKTFDIVLAYYSEAPDVVRQQIQYLKSLPALAPLAPRVILYTKGLGVDSTHEEQEALRRNLDVDILRVLPNVGREADTYLAHISEHYDELAGHTLFGQGDMEYLEWAGGRLQNHFNDRLGFMSLHHLPAYTMCYCDGCFVPGGSPDPVYGFKRIPQLYSMFNERICPPEGLLLTYKGQFVVSRQRITRNSREKFAWLRSILTNMTHWVHDDPTDERDLLLGFAKHDPLNPLFGHTLERSWPFLFGCNDLDLLYTCGDERCACYD